MLDAAALLQAGGGPRETFSGSIASKLATGDRKEVPCCSLPLHGGGPAKLPSHRTSPCIRVLQWKGLCSRWPIGSSVGGRQPHCLPGSPRFTVVCMWPSERLPICILPIQSVLCRELVLQINVFIQP